jgi:hypothetical protein
MSTIQPPHSVQNLEAEPSSIFDLRSSIFDLQISDRLAAAVAFISGFARMPFSQPAGGSHMAMQVCMGATMMCTMGMAPSSLVVLPTNRVMTDEVPDANIMDNIPLVNIMPFGMCMSPANPMVAAATAAAMGVLTPMPCIPATVAPWVPGAPTVLLGNMPTLDNTSTLMCMWAGVISFVMPGELTVMVP